MVTGSALTDIFTPEKRSYVMSGIRSKVGVRDNLVDLGIYTYNLYTLGVIPRVFHGTCLLYK